MSQITASEVYDALHAELADGQYIEKVDAADDLTCVTIDGIVDCGAIAEFLNRKAPTLR